MLISFQNVLNLKCWNFLYCRYMSVVVKIKTNQFKLPISKFKINMMYWRTHKNWILILLKEKNGSSILGDIYPQMNVWLLKNYYYSGSFKPY